jgi:hypothetical protein
MAAVVLCGVRRLTPRPYHRGGRHNCIRLCGLGSTSVWRLCSSTRMIVLDHEGHGHLTTGRAQPLDGYATFFSAWWRRSRCSLGLGCFQSVCAHPSLACCVLRAARLTLLMIGALVTLPSPASFHLFLRSTLLARFSAALCYLRW